VVTRDYKNVHNQYISFGPLVRKNGLGAHGTHYAIDDVYTRKRCAQTVRSNGGRSDILSLLDDELVCDVILRFATVTNGELAYRSYQDMEEKVGFRWRILPRRTAACASPTRMQSRPPVHQQSRCGPADRERPRVFAVHVQRRALVPWRTLTGRQHFYLDHPGYIQFGEHLPTYKPKPMPKEYADLRQQGGGPDQDAQLPDAARQVAHPLHLRRQPAHDNPCRAACEPFWMNDHGRRAEVGIVDNDWVEVHNDTASW
jgi:nitrate reductase alpha subunit